MNKRSITAIVFVMVIFMAASALAKDIYIQAKVYLDSKEQRQEIFQLPLDIIW